MPNQPQKTKSREQLEKSWARKNNAIAVQETVKAVTTVAVTAAVVMTAFPELKDKARDAWFHAQIKRSQRKERRDTKVHNITNVQ